MGAKGGTSIWRREFTLAVLLFTYMLSFVDRQILSLMVDSIGQDLKIDDVQIGLLQGAAFALLYSIFGVPCGAFADRYSRKFLIIGGIVFWSIATSLCGLATGFWMLFLSRMAVGLGEAVLAPAAHSLLAASYPPHRLGRAMGIYSLGISCGAGVALLAGSSILTLVSSLPQHRLPFLENLAPWRITFMLLLIPGFIAAMLMLLVREPKREPAPHGAGSGLAALFDHLARHKWVFVPLYLSPALLGIMAYSMMAWFPTFLHRTHGLSMAIVGRDLGWIYLFAGGFGSIAGGWAADRLAIAGVDKPHLRVIFVIALLAVPFAATAPVVSSLPVCLVLFAGFCALANAYFGCAAAAIQLASPVELRAKNAALFLLVNGLIAMTVGGAAVPLLQRVIVAGMHFDLGASLALVGASVSGGAAVMAATGLIPDRKIR